MRSTRQSRKPHQVETADALEAIANATRTPKHSATGFLLLSTALKPLYVSPQAAQILFHPEKPAKTKHFAEQLTAKIRTMVANGARKARIPECKEFLSGGRHYTCRFFNVHSPGNKSSGANGSSLALLLERSAEGAADVLKICQQFHLTPREEEAVRFLAQGLANKEIATRMNISTNTLKVFLRLAMMKMGVTSRSGIMSKFIHANT
jgi:DNA-binding CsgD family transcriptional regulator